MDGWKTGLSGYCRPANLHAASYVAWDSQSFTAVSQQKALGDQVFQQTKAEAAESHFDPASEFIHAHFHHILLVTRGSAKMQVEGSSIPFLDGRNVTSWQPCFKTATSFGILECIWHVKIQFSSKIVVKNAPKSAKYALLLSKYHIPQYLPNEIFSQFKKSKSYFWVDVSCFAKYFILWQPGILPCIISRYGELQHLNKIFLHILLTGISFDFKKSVRLKKNFYRCQRFIMNKPWLLISFNNSDIFPGPICCPSL